jgi:glycosyltransferase involved in cell wall biosynthesis
LFNPKVSILIPVYNGSDFLSFAIDSALDQSYKNVEIIVINDGSNDSGLTEKIALSYGNKIKYLAKPNGGVASALNLGIKVSRGEYISWLSHDDLYLKNKIKWQVKALASSNKNKNIVYGDYSIFYDKSSLGVTNVKFKKTSNFRYFLTSESTLHGCTLLIPKKAFIDCGFFNTHLITTQDYEMWFRLSAKYTFVHIPKILVKARQHQNQGSKKMQQIAHKECDALFFQCIKKMTKLEIILGGNNSLSYGYSKLAFNMAMRGFKKSFLLAYSLAIKNFYREPFFALLKSCVCLLRSKLTIFFKY